MALAICLGACQRDPTSAPSPDDAGLPRSDGAATPSCCWPDELRCFEAGEGICTCSPAVWAAEDPSGLWFVRTPVPDPFVGWSCTWSASTYACAAEPSNERAPASCPGWTCSGDGGQVRCARPPIVPAPPLPAGRHWSCSVNDTAMELVCTSVSDSKDECQAGDKKWCDGLQYDGWGQVDCDPATRRWKRKTLGGGQQTLDCLALADGRRPSTVCACYHFFFNPVCCERPDCVLPPGTSGQLCPKSKGALCDYCNPMAPECTEPGAVCIVTNGHETFCGRPCSATAPCPAGYDCLTVKQVSGSTQQCVPGDFSCYL